MSEMVERVAKAIYALQFGKPWAGNFSQDDARVCARTAIEAMRQPTEEMEIEGLNANPRGPSVYPDYDAKRIWSSMIDVALSTEKEGAA